MAQMIRKQVYIEPMQDTILKKRSRMLGITEAEVIRRAIDTHVVLMHSGLRDLEAWEREKAFIAETTPITSCSCGLLTNSIHGPRSMVSGV